MPEISPTDIENLAKDIEALRVGFVDKVKGIGTAQIEAGALPEAEELERKAKAGSTAAAALRDNLDAALASIVSNLTTSAAIYAGGETNNKAAGEKLDALITSLKKNLPGFDPADD